MIKTVNLQKIFKTEEVQTLALNDVNIEVERRGVLLLSWDLQAAENPLY